jgi:hypothetical protein
MLTLVSEGSLVQIAQAQYGRARIAAVQGHYEDARSLGSVCLASFERIGYRMAGEVRNWLDSLPTKYRDAVP